MDLIKTVRGLDQNGPGDAGENLQSLWNCLVASSDVSFHVAEENGLRWLLKSMNGVAPTAETLRRYPLTWTIMNCMFQRIPLFPLAKILADRKFIAVLQLTLKELSEPIADSDTIKSSKRKRSRDNEYNLSSLIHVEQCLVTASAVFISLKTLLDRLDDQTVTSSRNKIGAEHIKSLFCVSAADAVKTISPCLELCRLLLTEGTIDEDGSAHYWMQTSSALWDFHLQANEDVEEVANNLFKPAALLLNELEDLLGDRQIKQRSLFQLQWSQDLQSFMRRNFVLPARATFIGQQSCEAITVALAASRSVMAISALALYFFATTVSQHLTEGDSRRKEAEWMKHVFGEVNTVVSERPDRISMIHRVIQRAVSQSAPVDVQSLRMVCRDYAMKGEFTNWGLIASAAKCEPDIFQRSEEGNELLHAVCDLSMSGIPDEETSQAIVTLIAAIYEGFRINRDLVSFYQLWFRQMQKIEQRHGDAQSPWFTVGRAGCLQPSVPVAIETDLSPQQLSELLDFAESQQSGNAPQATCAFANTIAHCICSEPFVDISGRRLLDLVLPIKEATHITALKWRVIGKTFLWLCPADRIKAWNDASSSIIKCLNKSPITSAQAFEAFKCCSQLVDIMSPDDEKVKEPKDLLVAFTSRLTKAITSSGAFNGSWASSMKPNVLAEYREDFSLEQYLSWILFGSSRFIKSQPTPKDLISILVSETTPNDDALSNSLRATWSALVHNDINVNDARISVDLAEGLINALEQSGKEKGWPGEMGRVILQRISAAPSDIFSRRHRERIMEILSNRRPKMLKSPKRVSIAGWKLFLGVATKLVARPTYYDGMSFSHLADTAEAICGLKFESSTSQESLQELMERYKTMVSATVRQMAENIDERSLKYFEGARQFVRKCEAELDRSKPLFITLLNALAVELKCSLSRQNVEALATLQRSTTEAVSKSVALVIGTQLSSKKPFTTREAISDLELFAAVDAVAVAGDGVSKLLSPQEQEVRQLEARSKEAMLLGDLRGWKIQAFLHRTVSTIMVEPLPKVFGSLENVPFRMQGSLINEQVVSITRHLNVKERGQYLRELAAGFANGCDTNGQILAIKSAVDQVTDATSLNDLHEPLDLAIVQDHLAKSLARPSTTTMHACRVLYSLLEKNPQEIGQWNVELTLSTICSALPTTNTDKTPISFAALCKLVEIIIKKHRLRLEGHYHVILATLQALLRYLVNNQTPASADATSMQASNAERYARLITLICEPTAGAVSRSHNYGALDSATDAAKRSAGRHMYMIMMMYVKLQLETSVPVAVRDAMEPAMNSIFDITSPEGRKILNDAMDGSGRAILREMYKRYVKFGKWKGI